MSAVSAGTGVPHPDPAEAPSPWSGPAEAHSCSSGRAVPPTPAPTPSETSVAVNSTLSPGQKVGGFLAASLLLNPQSQAHISTHGRTLGSPPWLSPRLSHGSGVCWPQWDGLGSGVASLSVPSPCPPDRVFPSLSGFSPGTAFPPLSPVFPTFMPRWPPFLKQDLALLLWAPLYLTGDSGHPDCLQG